MWNCLLLNYFSSLHKRHRVNAVEINVMIVFMSLSVIYFTITFLLQVSTYSYFYSLVIIIFFRCTIHFRGTNGRTLYLRKCIYTLTVCSKKYNSLSWNTLFRSFSYLIYKLYTSCKYHFHNHSQIIHYF